jgi:hypothetical protein
MFSSSSIDWGAEIFFFFVKLLSVEISIYRFHIMLTRRIRRNPRACQTFGLKGIQLGSKVGRVSDSAAMPCNNELNLSESESRSTSYATG